jgi:hypothetical protein
MKFLIDYRPRRVCLDSWFYGGMFALFINALAAALFTGDLTLAGVSGVTAVLAKLAHSSLPLRAGNPES